MSAPRRELVRLCAWCGAQMPPDRPGDWCGCRRSHDERLARLWRVLWPDRRPMVEIRRELWARALARVRQ